MVTRKAPAAKKAAAKKPAAPAAKKPGGVPALSTRKTGGALSEMLSKYSAGAMVAIGKAPVAGSQSLSFRNGVMTYMGKTIGNEINVILLHTSFERSYFSGPYNADNPTPPDCYSYDGETPHPDATDKQADRCEDCPMAQWESGQNGRGKACKEGLRMALLLVPKGIDEGKAESFPIVTAKLSVMNTKNLSGFIGALYEQMGNPFRAILNLTCNPDPQIQVAIGLEAIEEITDQDVLEALANRVPEADTELNRPYPNAAEMNKGKTASKGKPGGRNAGSGKRTGHGNRRY